jgi:hypothetical protein
MMWGGTSEARPHGRLARVEPNTTCPINFQYTLGGLSVLLTESKLGRSQSTVVDGDGWRWGICGTPDNSGGGYFPEISH